MQFSYYSPALAVLWKLLKANNVDPDKVFSRYNLKYHDLKNTQCRVPLKTVTQLWDDALAVIDNPCFGLDSCKYWHPGYMGALGYAWLSSSTLREGFERLSRYISLISNNSSISLSEDDQEFTINLNYGQLGNNPARSDNALSILLHMCRINYQDELNPSQVSFAHKEPECSGNYFACFKSAVNFNAACNSLSFPLQFMDETLPGSNKQLAQLNDQVMVQYLSEIEKYHCDETDNNLQEKIKIIIVKKLPSGLVTGQLVADELGMSYRSMQRRLAESGTTFRQLFEQCRHELAEQYVNNGDLNMTEITFMMGFSELSSFSRAYKRWTGHSPRH